jgi:alpha,alpha-trehalase
MPMPLSNHRPAPLSNHHHPTLSLRTPSTRARLIHGAAALLFALPLACATLTARAQTAASAAIAASQIQQDLQAAPASEALPASAASATPRPPSELFGQLYRDVEMAQVFPDSKTFADMAPNEAPAKIVAEYESWSAHNAGITDPDARRAALAQFVAQHFSDPKPATDSYVSDPNQNVVSHIDTLWDVLRRDPDTAQPPHSSLLPLPKPYVVPGGRFNEIYYWDSYFIMLGLEASGRYDLMRDELDNFAALIDRYGHIPNGNRTYYLSRSQPPFFAQMVALVAQRDGDATYVRYLPELRKEYDYWMAGADTLKPGEAARHVVRLPDGTLLNRYWDARDTPRDESYREDVLTAQATPQSAAPDLWRNLRAGGETGWDFSSRWFADQHTLSTIDITSLVPVDLNALLVDLERALAKAYGLQGDAGEAQRMSQRAQQRAAAIGRVLWDPQLHAFSDYDFVHHTLTHRLTAATVYPLYVGIATRAQAHQVAGAVRAGLLRPGGLATTQVASGQQWDEPNGWAPLQYLAVTGLRRYGESALAQAIATRWIATNLVYYRRTHKLVEKYDISAAAAKASSAGGGEYPLQDGFGWTNGVLRVLLQMYPHTESAMGAHTANAAANAH